MKEEEIKKYFIGKTIKDIELSYDYDVCIESITFTNGDVVEIFGRSDYARICSSSVISDGSVYDYMKGIKKEYEGREGFWGQECMEEPE